MNFTIAFLLGVATPVVCLFIGLLIARCASINDYESDDRESTETLKAANDEVAARHRVRAGTYGEKA